MSRFPSALLLIWIIDVLLFLVLHLNICYFRSVIFNFMAFKAISFIISHHLTFNKMDHSEVFIMQIESKSSPLMLWGKENFLMDGLSLNEFWENGNKQKIRDGNWIFTILHHPMFRRKRAIPSSVINFMVEVNRKRLKCFELFLFSQLNKSVKDTRDK